MEQELVQKSADNHSNVDSVPNSGGFRGSDYLERHRLKAH
jgi:hypothetical protein